MGVGRARTGKWIANAGAIGTFALVLLATAGCSFLSDFDGYQYSDGAVADGGKSGDAGMSDGSTFFCGDGVQEGLEQCDDGNRINGDGCSGICATEAVGVCGDGVLFPTEQCDDGNMLNNDGCSMTCMFETAVCQDGVKHPSEECDDGNAIAGDGCSPLCVIEPSGVCQDNVRHPTEECDDGNDVAMDGCSPTCTVDACGTFQDWIGCNQTLSGNTKTGGSIQYDSYECLPNMYKESGPEVTIAFRTPVPTTVDFALSVQSGVDLDFFVIPNAGSGCNDTATCAAWDYSGGAGVAESVSMFAAEANVTYYIVVDTFVGPGGNAATAGGSFSLSLTCTP